MKRADAASILGIAVSASREEINVAYQKLAMKFHPDRNPGLAEHIQLMLNQRFSELTHARQVMLAEIDSIQDAGHGSAASAPKNTGNRAAGRVPFEKPILSQEQLGRLFGKCIDMIGPIERAATRIPSDWKVHRVIHWVIRAIAFACVLSFGAGVFILRSPSGWWVIVLIIGLGLAFLSLRTAKSRSHFEREHSIALGMLNELLIRKRALMRAQAGNASDSDWEVIRMMI